MEIPQLKSLRFHEFRHQFCAGRNYSSALSLAASPSDKPYFLQQARLRHHIECRKASTLAAPPAASMPLGVMVESAISTECPLLDVELKPICMAGVTQVTLHHGHASACVFLVARRYLKAYILEVLGADFLEHGVIESISEKLLMVPKFDHATYSGGRGFGTLLDAGNNDILKILPVG